jgi:hypothetical protein
MAKVKARLDFAHKYDLRERSYAVCANILAASYNPTHTQMVHVHRPASRADKVPIDHRKRRRVVIPRLPPSLSMRIIQMSPIHFVSLPTRIFGASLSRAKYGTARE